MKDLWPDTRALLDAGRDGEEPSAHDYERNRRALVRKLGAGVMVASAGVASTTSVAAAGGIAGSGVVTSVILSFVLGGAVGGAAAISTRTHEDASHRAGPVVSTMPTPSTNQGAPTRANGDIHARIPQWPALTAEGETTATSPREGRSDALPRAPHDESVVEARPMEIRPAPPRGTTAEAPSPVRGSVSSNVEEELGLLRAAQERMHTGAPAAALAILDEHARRFPGGALAEERRASRILALCQLGEVATGRAEADQFIAQLPMSPFVERIRRACSP